MEKYNKSPSVRVSYDCVGPKKQDLALSCFRAPEMAGMAAGMAVEEFREQLREWREDGGRHSDEVRRNPEQKYFSKANQYVYPNFAKSARIRMLGG